MPASITLTGLSAAAPDGRTLFSDLDLTFAAERTGLIGRNGVGKTTLLRLIAGETAPRAGTVATGGRLGLLRQNVAPRAGEILSDLFGATAALALLARAEAGTASAAELAEADWTLEARMAAALAGMGLAGIEADTPLAALSGGEATRAALAALVFDAPDFLLLDEPTNNLDRDGRDAVRGLLAGWKAGAIVVSHDRDLLEEMDAIVELTTLGATRHGGNFSAFRARKALELAAAAHELADAEKRVAAVQRTARQRAERQARLMGAGRSKAARGDEPKILLGTLKGRAQETAGRHSLLAEQRQAEAGAALETARAQIEILTPFAVDMPPSGLPAGRLVLALERVSAGYDPARPVLRDLSLRLTGPERVAITGPNGAGKSTLLRVVTGKLAPLAGTVSVPVRHAMLDQRVGLLDPALSVAENFARLNPEADRTACRAALARFMFRADAALQPAGSLSGGELLRAGLACVLGVSPPQLLILDEPTNHLDIESIETIEAGLLAYDGALLVVSHDTAFLDAIGVTRQVELGCRGDAMHKRSAISTNAHFVGTLPVSCGRQRQGNAAP